MRILVLAERLSNDPWLPEALAWSLLGELAERGHSITLACDAAEEPARLTAMGILPRQRDRFCYRKQPKLGPLARWLRRTDQRLAGSHDAVLSLSWLCTADVWMPIGPTAMTQLLNATRRFDLRGRLPRMLCGDAVYGDTKVVPSVLRRGLAEYLARTRSDRIARLSGIVVHSEAAAADARRLVSELISELASRSQSRAGAPSAASTDSPNTRIENDVQRPMPSAARCKVINARACGTGAGDAAARSVVSGGNGSRLSPMAGAELRNWMRAQLGIGPGETVALVPRMNRIDRITLALFEAAGRQRGPHKPVRLLVVCPDPFAVSRNAAAVGCTLLTTVAPTHRFEALLLACDVGVLVDAPAKRPFFAGSAHRAAADFLRRSRPVLCLAGTGAAELIGPVAERAAGVVLPAGDLPSWHKALATAADPSWRISAGVTARATADVFGLSPATLAVEVERALATAGRQRQARRELAGVGGR